MLAMYVVQALTVERVIGAIALAGLASLTWHFRTRSKPQADEAPPMTPCAHHVDMQRQLERGEKKFLAIDKKLDRQTVAQGEIKGSLGRIEGFLEAMR